ncbi:hypothetical protein NPIL_588401 [Nephila pilipes]|uniref:non-specific serine/threonine protein kinase n=1 Tax=Nephila pilipes TaxID=299642 RepID=A0A8X6T3Z7_NEPPI|nr:hypothetical protein NPIL_588401 [Nephila pilipes]
MYKLNDTLADITSRYKLLDVIGRGSYGTVQCAKRLKDNVLVSIKTVRHQNKDPSEIYFLNKLKNVEGVISLYEYRVCLDGYILIMKYFKTDLHDFWDKNLPLPKSTIKRVLFQIVEICTTLFGLNVYHGDLKMENIVIRPETLKIKLIDFGSAGYVNKKRKICGTKHYLPPEYHELRIYKPEKALVWSIGIILLELVTGESAENYILKSRSAKMFCNIIDQCLTIDYVKRIKLNELKNAIKDFQ